MLRQRIDLLLGWLRRVVTQPREELNRWQRAARFAYDLGRYGGRQLQRDHAPQMAAALSFRTLFALLPVLVVSMIVVKATQGAETFLRLVRDLFESMHLDGIHVIVPGQIGGGAAEQSVSLATWLEDLIGQAADVNLAAVGWIGVGIICYAAISLMVTIENSFNAIYHAAPGRPWTRRIPLYWFVLTVSPVALGITWYLNAYVATWMEWFEGWQTLLLIAGFAWSALVSWLLFLAVYTLLPNTSVAWKPAMAGALVATLLFEIGKRFLDAYLGHAFSISQLYGSLGLVPLFMFWVYLMWLAVLFGLEVCAILQRLGGRELDAMQPGSMACGLVEPVAVIPIMEVIADRFAAGKPTQAREISDRTRLPESVVDEALGQLVAGSLIHRLEREPGAVTLARPPDQIPIRELIEIGFRMVDDGGACDPSPWTETLRRVQRQAVGQATLADTS